METTLAFALTLALFGQYSIGLVDAAFVSLNQNSFSQSIVLTQGAGGGASGGTGSGSIGGTAGSSLTPGPAM